MQFKTLFTCSLILWTSYVCGMDVEPTDQSTIIETDQAQTQLLSLFESLPQDVLVLIYIHATGPVFTPEDWSKTETHSHGEPSNYDSHKLCGIVDQMINDKEVPIAILLRNYGLTCKKYLLAAQHVFKTHLETLKTGYNIFSIAEALQQSLQQNALQLHDIIDSNQCTALHWASHTDDCTNVTQILLYTAQNKVSLLFACSSAKRTALHHAAVSGNTAICQVLLSAADEMIKALFMCKDLSENTALRCASNLSQSKTMQYLAKIGLDLGLNDSYGILALQASGLQNTASTEE